jgi:hypothetical protein
MGMKLRAFEKRVLRRIFRPKRDDVTKYGENCIIRRFITFSLYQAKLE